GRAEPALTDGAGLGLAAPEAAGASAVGSAPGTSARACPATAAAVRADMSRTAADARTRGDLVRPGTMNPSGRLRGQLSGSGPVSRPRTWRRRLRRAWLAASPQDQRGW